MVLCCDQVTIPSVRRTEFRTEQHSMGGTRSHSPGAGRNSPMVSPAAISALIRLVLGCCCSKYFPRRWTSRHKERRRNWQRCDRRSWDPFDRTARIRHRRFSAKSPSGRAHNIWVPLSRKPAIGLAPLAGRVRCPGSGEVDLRVQRGDGIAVVNATEYAPPSLPTYKVVSLGLVRRLAGRNRYHRWTRKQDRPNQ